MPDTNFEALLSRQLREYAEPGVRPIDRFAIAEETIAGGRKSSAGRWASSPAPIRSERYRGDRSPSLPCSSSLRRRPWS